MVVVCCPDIAASSLTGGGWTFFAVFAFRFVVLGLRVTVLGALLLGVLSLADVLALALGFLNSFLICL